MAKAKAKILPVLITLIAYLWGSPGAAPVKAEHLEAELLAEPSAIQAGKPFWIGLRLKMEPDWHVYWKNPGDAGLPVSLTWQNPAEFVVGSIQWPYPQRIELEGLVNYGYEGEIILPMEVTPPIRLPAGSPVELTAKVKWLVCKEVCLPGSALLTLSLPVSPSTSALPPPDPARAGLFTLVRSMLPLPSTAWRFSALATDTAFTLLITGPPETRERPEDLVFYPDEQEIIDGMAPQKFFPIAGGYALELRRVAQAGDPASASTPDTLAGIVVSARGWNGDPEAKAALVQVALTKGKPPEPLAAPVITTGKPIAHTASPAPSATSAAGWASSAKAGSATVRLLSMLLLAFLGGLILNLMPCVLPVLSLKIFDFVKRAGQARWKVFSHGLVFTGGVLVSFWVLAGLLLILRQGGQELGWGFQLQSPSFLIVLCALFFFFSLNLFGVFEMGYLFTRLGGTGTQHGFAGSFFAGVTATVVATPCTAPFMGSAMGYAFTQPPHFAMLVFTFLGLGMSAPYLLLSGFPGLMRFLPKPGEWMEHLKQFMGFPLLATAIWLAWVLGKQAGVDALAALLFVLLLAGISAWILGKWTALHRSTPVRVIAGLLALVIFLPAFVLILIFVEQFRAAPQAASGVAQAPVDGIAWEPFTPEKLEAFNAGGRPVFIDFTADWCLSCKVNEKVALNSPEVTRKFRELGLTALKADWTLRDETISRALGKYGRNSIPLYVLYTGKGAEYVFLPEILSPGIVLEALDKLPNSATTRL